MFICVCVYFLKDNEKIPLVTRYRNQQGVFFYIYITLKVYFEQPE